MSTLTHANPLVLDEKERILILAPHPDDECLAAGGLIASMRHCHPEAELRVVIATNGDASYSAAIFHGSHLPTRQNFRSLALQRQQESLMALSRLGVDRSQVSFWGFPDQGLAKLRSFYWDDQAMYTSPTTGFYLAEQTINSPWLRYTGKNLLSLLQNELVRFKPTTIISPHPEDAHPDHQTLALLTLQAADALYKEQLFPKMLAYMTWSRNSFVALQSHRTKSTSASTHSENAWQAFSFSKAIQEQKEKALSAYRSQNVAAMSQLKAGARSTQERFIQLVQEG